MNINKIEDKIHIKIAKTTSSALYKYKAKVLFAIAKLLNITIGFEHPFVYDIENKKEDEKKNIWIRL